MTRTWSKPPAQGILEVRNKKLYRIEYGTFEEFCEKELGFSDNYIHRLMNSAKVVENLPIGKYLPQTESQARPLTKLEPETQREAWRETTETHSRPKPID